MMHTLKELKVILYIVIYCLPIYKGKHNSVKTIYIVEDVPVGHSQPGLHELPCGSCLQPGSPLGY